MGKIMQNAKNNASGLLIGAGCVGLVFTAYSVYKQTPRYLAYKEKNAKMGKLERSKGILATFWPSFVLGAGTMVCFISAHKLDIKKQAALASGMAIAESRLMEYQSKVVEELGEKTDKKIRDAIAIDKVNENPPPQVMPMIENDIGEVLCYDVISGRYFTCTVERIRQAENRINQAMITDMYASLNEFYDLLGLEGISIGDDIGWNVDRLLDVDLTTAKISPDGRPCQVLNYYVAPRYEYDKLM